MQIVATQKNQRTAPRKLRLVANQVKDLGLEGALRQLAVINRRATMPLLKVIRQALANAEHNHRLGIKDLELKSIEITDGTTYKRMRAVSRGRGHGIEKRSSHIKVVLESVVKPAASSEKSVHPKSATKAAPKAQAQKNSAAKTPQKEVSIDESRVASEAQKSMNPAAQAPVAQAKPSRAQQAQARKASTTTRRTTSK